MRILHQMNHPLFLKSLKKTHMRIAQLIALTVLNLTNRAKTPRSTKKKNPLNFHKTGQTVKVSITEVKAPWLINLAKTTLRNLHLPLTNLLNVISSTRVKIITMSISSQNNIKRISTVDILTNIHPKEPLYVMKVKHLAMKELSIKFLSRILSPHPAKRIGIQ
jgi:hypothetical protein